MVGSVTLSRPINIVLLGPPGSGKSTVSEALAAHHNLVVIATGQRLRAEITARSVLGRSISGYLDKGNLIPDSLMDRLLRSYLDSLDPERGFLLDGYPRTIAQATGLIGIMADYQHILDAVIALEVDDEEIVRRLSGRRICEGAGDPFPIHIDDLTSIIRCRERGGHPVQRDDDRPEVVRQRIAVYHEQTHPLLEFYEQQGLLLRVDAVGSSADVFRRIEIALEERIATLG
ncbi:MAG: adenylate kinase [Chloroflexota bacterium]